MSVLFLYLFFLLLLSFRYRKQSSLKSYYLGGADVSTFKLSFSLLATILGASSSIGLVGLAYEIGLPASLWLILGAGGLCLLSLIYKRYNFLSLNFTFPEYLGRAYGERVKRALAFIIFISWIGVISAQFLALSRLFNFYFPGMDFRLILFFSSAVLLCYTASGGQKAVLFTDVIQFFLFLGGILFLTLILFSKFQFRPLFLNSEYFRFPLNRFFKIKDFLYFFIVLIPVYIIGPDIHSRLFCSQDVKNRKRSLLSTGLVLILIGFLFSLLGLYAHSFYPEITPDTALFHLSKDFLNSEILFYLFLLALVSLIFSSADTCLLTSATIFVRDLLGYRDEAGIKFSRLSILFIGLISYVFALYFRKIVELLLLAYSVYTAGTFIPFLLIPFKERLRVSERSVCWSILSAGGFAFMANILNFKIGILISYFLSAFVIFIFSQPKAEIWRRKVYSRFYS